MMTDTPQTRLGDEQGRLRAVHRYDILDTAPEEEFADIVRLVKTVFAVPMAAVTFIDQDRQWTKAGEGGIPDEVPRALSFCARTIEEADALPVPDATADPRFARNPFVTEGGVRCYLGVPLTTPDGYNVGALCIVGTEPRDFGSADIEVLRHFAKLVMSQMELRQIARSDGLTGAMTRRAFVERLTRAVETAEGFSVVLLDIDHFKSINDRFGHPAGDEVLRHVAGLLRQNPLPGECLGRLGGEEFALLLPGADLAAALVRAEDLRKTVAARNWPDLEDGSVTISLGVVDWRPAETAVQILARGDIALYAAKRSGRNRSIAAGTESDAPV